MSKREEIYSSIDEYLRGEGFSKRGANWYREKIEVTQIINLQKSQFGNQYYINFGVFVKKLEPAIVRFPKEYVCHIRDRVSPQGDNTEADFAASLDADNEKLSREQRKKVIVGSINRTAMRIFAQCDSLDGIRTCFHEGTLQHHLMSKSLVEMMERKN